MANILIRCDASKEIGFGHVMRCLTLAKEAIKHCHVIFAMKYGFGIEKVRLNGFKVEHIINEEEIKTIIQKYNIDIFIGDTKNGLSVQNIKELKQQNIFCVALDESNEYAKECDLCFYPPHAIIDTMKYKGKVFIGWEYIPLREEFYNNYKNISDKVVDVLVMLGGTDACNLTSKVIKKILCNYKDINLHVVLSKSQKDFEYIKNQYKKISIYSNVDDVVSLMKQMDYAIVSFGVSAYELVSLHIPATHICLNNDHLQASKFFVKKNFAIQVYKDLHSPHDLIDFNLRINSNYFKQCKIVSTILKEYKNAI